MPSTIASCHCGGTRIELPVAPASATRCTCTFCTKSGGLWAYYEVDAPRILSDTHGAVYSPTSPLHAHHFCARCGCTTYGTSPDYSLDDVEVPEKMKLAVNVRLLDDYELYRALPVEEIDGRNLW
ncbi:MAG TPA: GFA family protein [Devosiaceae bacterium]|jgi:hypothetical protein|nr:GFA family protein [Devosiaceae bacterium]